MKGIVIVSMFEIFQVSRLNGGPPLITNTHRRAPYLGRETVISHHTHRTTPFFDDLPLRQLSARATKPRACWLSLTLNREIYVEPSISCFARAAELFAAATFDSPRTTVSIKGVSPCSIGSTTSR